VGGSENRTLFGRNLTMLFGDDGQSVVIRAGSKTLEYARVARRLSSNAHKISGNYGTQHQKPARN
jgi:hypothetical protein